MNDTTALPPAVPAPSGSTLGDRAAAVREEVSKAFIGQPDVLD